MLLRILEFEELSLRRTAGGVGKKIKELILVYGVGCKV